MKSFATPLLILSTLSGMHAAPTAHSDSSRIRLAKKDTGLTMQYGTKEEPLQTLYIRGGMLVGDKIGYFNDSIAKHGPMDIGMNMTHLSLGLEPDITVGDVNIDLLQSALGVAVLAAVVCAVLPGCPAYVAANLGFSGAATAIETVTAAAAGAPLTEVNKDALVKRDDTEDEKWSCIAVDGWLGSCDNQAIVPGYVTAIANADNADPTTYGSTYWVLSEAADGTVFSHWYHCTTENGNCPLIGDGAPTATKNLGSAAGH